MEKKAADDKAAADKAAADKAAAEKKAADEKAAADKKAADDKAAKDKKREEVTSPPRVKVFYRGSASPLPVTGSDVALPRLFLGSDLAEWRPGSEKGPGIRGQGSRVRGRESL